MKKLYTSEMVCPGHPDKLCDNIADAILTDYLKHDENSRVAIEVSAGAHNLFIMGEVTSNHKCNIEKIARQVITSIGYNNDELGFNGNNINIIVDIHNQSPDISQGVSKSIEGDLGAGDQGIMFGYATNETPSYLPLSYFLSIELAKKLDEVRNHNILNYLRPDAKMQVTIEYLNNKPNRVDTIILSTQHNPNININTLRQDIENYVIKKVIPQNLLQNTKILINPTGNFVIGGPFGDSGLTGRKIIVDTYGGYAHHGGGSFSGKDPTKVDRSAAYYARYVAKNIVAANLADICEISISYAIGVSTPISLTINTYNTNKIEESKILDIINQIFDFRPSNIIKELDLKHIDYSKICNYGHFSHQEVSYEQLDKVSEILKLI